MSYCLITGGGTGIGKGFAHAFADLGYHLILTSRNLDNLLATKKEIEKKYSVKVLIFVSDLTKEASRKELFDYISNYELTVLVNNAGIGDSNTFDESSFEKDTQIIDLNITAVHHLFKHYYQTFKTLGHGRIINVASMAGFVAGPYAATYYASKAYVTSLTKAVIKEAKKSGVLIQGFFPGSTKTNFHLTANTQKKYYKADPIKVAKIAAESKKHIIIPGLKNKLMYILIKFLPTSFSTHIAYKRQKRMRNKNI